MANRARRAAFGLLALALACQGFERCNGALTSPHEIVFDAPVVGKTLTGTFTATVASPSSILLMDFQDTSGPPGENGFFPYILTVGVDKSSSVLRVGEFVPPADIYGEDLPGPFPFPGDMTGVTFTLSVKFVDEQNVDILVNDVLYAQHTHQSGSSYANVGKAIISLLTPYLNQPQPTDRQSQPDYIIESVSFGEASSGGGGGGGGGTSPTTSLV